VQLSRCGTAEVLNIELVRQRDMLHRIQQCGIGAAGHLILLLHVDAGVDPATAILQTRYVADKNGEISEIMTVRKNGIGTLL
jgi:hypothetical protein